LFDWIVGEQLQHADVVSRPDTRAESLLEEATKFGEHTGQLPVAIDRRVIECRRLVFQS